jgi:hypothetical protein
MRGLTLLEKQVENEPGKVVTWPVGPAVTVEKGELS